MRLLGLDPGLQRTGWGVIEVDGNLAALSRRRRRRDAMPAIALATRLDALYRGLQEVVALHRPDAAAVEETVVNGNAGSSLKLGQARGVVLLAAAHAGLPVTEYASKTVKRSVVGTGAAEKRQVAMMVRTLLPGSGEVGGRCRRRAGGGDLPCPPRRHPAPAGSGARRGGERRDDRPAARPPGFAAAPDHAVVDVGGVGYLVLCSARTLAALPRPGEAVDLHVETQVREESIMLYGFANRPSAAGSACCRPCRGWARGWRSACSRCWRRTSWRARSPARTRRR